MKWHYENLQNYTYITYNTSQKGCPKSCKAGTTVVSGWEITVSRELSELSSYIHNSVYKSYWFSYSPLVTPPTLSLSLLILHFQLQKLAVHCFADSKPMHSREIPNLLIICFFSHNILWWTIDCLRLHRFGIYNSILSIFWHFYPCYFDL